MGIYTIEDRLKHHNNTKNEYMIKYRKETLIKQEKVLLDYYNGELLCERCGITSEWGRKFFQWHHKEPQHKEAKIGTLIRNNNKDKLVLELEKCMCLCPNCHSLIHLETWDTSCGIANKKKWGSNR